MRTGWKWEGDDEAYDEYSNAAGYYRKALSKHAVDTDYLTDEETTWLDILHAAKDSPGLTDLVNQCKMYYALGKE